MSSTAERLPTFEELYEAIEALPAGITGEILEPGIIRTMGRPGGPHRFAAFGIRRSLGGDDASEGGAWWLEQEVEIRLLGDRLAVPDLSGWRLGGDDPVPPAFIYVNPVVVTPDWCCEILSTSTARVDRETKVPLYSAAGVGWVWLVSPEARTVEVLRTEDGGARLVETIEGDVTRAVPPFETAVDTSRWWLPPGP